SALDGLSPRRVMKAPRIGTFSQVCLRECRHRRPCLQCLGTFRCRQGRESDWGAVIGILFRIGAVMQKRAVRIAAFCLTLLCAAAVPVRAQNTFSGTQFDAGATVQPSLQPPTASIQGLQQWDPYADGSAAAIPQPVYTPQD